MSYEFQSSSGLTTGMTCYVRLRNSSANGNQMWNTSGTPAFENMTSAHVANYAIPAAEQGTMGCYEGAMPVAITVAGDYPWEMFQRVGSTPALTDPPICQGTLHWTGSAEAFTLSSGAANATNVAMNVANLDVNVLQIAGQTANAAGTVTFPGSIGTSTLTQSQITGGAYALETDPSGYVKLSSGTGTGQISLASGGVILQSGATPSAAAIAAAIQELGAISFVLVSPIMQNGSIQLVRGDDYYNADGRALSWSASAGAWPNLAGATVELQGAIAPSNDQVGAKTFNANGMISASGNGVTQSIYVEIPASTTQNLAPGTNAYGFAVVATLSDGHVVTLGSGTITVLND